jgi:subtilisin family serine protease
MGQAPLTQPYKGKGVIVGMIDTGIDFTHPDFLDSVGKSRILSYWDMTKGDSDKFTPLPYNYGHAWQKSDLDTALAHNIPAVINSMDSACTLEYGHGTHVSGVATSNGRANGLCIGAAPEADIMMVAYNFSNQSATEMTDAVSYIYNQADVYGEPCVINASLGDYDGSHDGQDLQAVMIDSMITAKPGRVLVAASGNGSNIPYHVGYTVTPGDTSFTWFAYYPSNGGIYFDAWADTNSFRNIKYSIGADRVKPFSYISGTPYSTVLKNMGVIQYDTLRNKAGDQIGTIEIYTERQGSTFSLQVQINPDSASYYWRLMTTGSGKIDCWYPDPTPMVDTGLPSPSVFPEIKNYKMPDTISTLCSSFQCSSNVITVGDYINRRCYYDYDTSYYCLFGSNVIEGLLTNYSGVGPTRDGRIKPDITSPGDICMSALPTPFKANSILSDTMGIDQGGWHHYDGGTSTASPGTAGAAALYLEMHPNATNIEVRNAIIYCSDQDAFTGTTPNNSYGFGKVDAFKALTGCALSVPAITAPNTALLAYPNPASNGTTIEYDFESMNEYCTASILIIDVMGRQLMNVELKNNKGNVSVPTNTLASGEYFYSLMVDGRIVHTEKLLVTK